MKKIILLAALMLTLTSCGGNTEQKPAGTEAPTEAATEQTEATEATEAPKEESKELVLDQPITLGDFEVTVKEYRLSKDYDGKDVLVITYNWKNNSNETTAPYMSIMFKGFQDGVETDDMLFVDDVDLGVGQKEVKPGASIENCFATVGITDLSKPLELELDELITLSSDPYKTTIDLSTLN